ncbi:Hypothetical predicted protein [Paramuricea clavata]|uniref:Uncharacterized protein n=1 Tax=Paramuricea clavata TaxID=317549 RepID=A0A7D9E9H3_PARCT|nr:Hypothetical predicted protein [Paramuricea clavata]
MCHKFRRIPLRLTPATLLDFKILELAFAEGHRISKNRFYALNAMKATWICVTLLLSQLCLVPAVHNITEALEALAPVPIEDLQTKTPQMEETDTSFSVTNIARKVEHEYWLMSFFVVLGYLLQ